jgi:hypothetical protein
VYPEAIATASGAQFTANGLARCSASTAMTPVTGSSFAASAATSPMALPKTAISMSPPMACAQLTHLAVARLRV